MITKVTTDFFDRRNYSEYMRSEDGPMNRKQRKTLENLIFARISNSDEVERRLVEIESYNYTDAREAIEDFLFAPFK